MKLMPVAAAVALLSGCNSLGYGNRPETEGGKSSNYGYIPLDGLAIDQNFDADSCTPWRKLGYTNEDSRPTTKRKDLAGVDPYRPLLESLPDLTVRFAVASFDAKGGLTFGPAKFTTKGNNYRAVLDYVNVDAIPLDFEIRKLMKGQAVPLGSPHEEGIVFEYEAQVVPPNTKASPGTYAQMVTIPIYVGVGMRLSADVTALEGGVPLVSLGAIGAEAQAKRLTGTLTVQTIGITGESVATALPLPSKLDQTTIENGILAIGNTRATIYRTQGSTIITSPRVVGLYSPIGSEPALVNAIYSALSAHRPKWPRPCIAVPSPKAAAAAKPK